jgi:ATP-dependent helicase HrpA
LRSKAAAFLLSIPEHLNPYLRIEDLHGKVLSQGRDLRRLLRDTHKAVAAAAPVVMAAAPSPVPTEGLRAWQCGDLPVEHEVQRKGVRFKVYPALQDRGDSVAVVELSNAIQAEQVMLGGVLRLLILALPQQYKFARQQFAGNRELMLLGQGSTGQQSLADGLAERALRECFLPEGQPLPRNLDAFTVMLEQHRAELNAIVTRLGTAMLNLFKDWRAVRQTLAKLDAAVFKQSTADIELQLSSLLPDHFLQATGQPWFGHQPRYMKALLRRVERLPGNVARDTQLLQQVQPYLQMYQQLLARKSLQQNELNKLKWMIEEFRVSLFAQELKTSIPVSAKRLDEQVELARKEAY